MGQPGFVYVLSNPAMPGLLKIGMTTKSPISRAEELSTTGVPAPFEIEFAVYTADASDLEKDCHYRFADRRFRASREFFRAGVDEVAVFLARRLPALDGYSVVSAEEDISYGQIWRQMNEVSTRDMHAIEVAAALELLTPEELRTLFLRHEAHKDQLRAQEAAADG